MLVEQLLLLLSTLLTFLFGFYLVQLLHVHLPTTLTSRFPAALQEAGRDLVRATDLLRHKPHWKHALLLVKSSSDKMANANSKENTQLLAFLVGVVLFLAAFNLLNSKSESDQPFSLPLTHSLALGMS